MPESDFIPYFLRNAGECGELIEAIDWAHHPLGPIADWPSSLQTLLGVVLHSEAPMFLWWSEDYICFYNDRYRPSLGVRGKHPGILGMPAKEAFPELWEYIGPLMKKVMDGGSVFLKDQHISIDRNGALEKTYWDFAYSPVFNPLGEVDGALVTCSETTGEIRIQENHRLEEVERRHRDQQLQMMIDILPASVVVIRGEDLIVELINRSNLEYWKKTPEEVIGRPFLEILPDLADQPFAGQLRQVMATGAIIDVKESPVLFENPDGSKRETFVDYTYQPLTDSSGRRNGVLVMSFEITDRVAARRELELSNARLVQSEARFRYLIQEAPVAIAVLSGRALTIQSANEMILKLWGKTKTIIGQPLASAMPELIGQPFLTLLDQVYKSGKSYYGYEIPAQVDHRGELLESWFNFVYQPIADNGAETTDIIVVAVDVTAQVHARNDLQDLNEEMAAANEELETTNEELTEIQKRYEEINRELETSASRLRMAIESTSLGTWEYNPQNGDLFWSNECREIYGIAADEVPSFEKFTDHIHPDDRLWVEAAIQKAMNPAGDGHYDLSYRIIRFDNGEVRWIKAQGSVYFDQRKPARFIGTVVDIHDLKEAEEKSAKLAAIIETSHDAIISKTLEGIVTSWNDSAQQVFGFTAEEMIGQSIYKLIPPDRHAEEPQILATIATGERINHFETKRLTKSGQLIDVSVTVSPVKDKAGRIIGVSKIARDITERKLDENRKNDFIGMVSHELKTPLTSLNAIIQMANIKLQQNEDRFLSGAMQRAGQQVKRMTTMINGFLNISRLESGKIHIDKQVFDLEILIRELIEEANLTVHSHQIHFEGHPPLIVTADREKISSVISNLISNAVKYSPKGEHVEVACKKCVDEIIVSVKDEGMGIKPDDLAKIFDRYYRVETNHTRNISGFGIGLYLSSEIIERHGGKVWADSKSGVGSTFYFSLPISGDPQI